MTRRPAVLVVEHESECPPALLGQWLEEAGCALHVCRPYAGDTLPDLASYDALVVLGGSMGANDDAAYPWLTRVKALIRSAAVSGVPTLGTCLGHQLAAVALGGLAGRNPHGPQIGLVETGWSAAAADDPLLGNVVDARRGVHWNLDLVTSLPHGALALASTPAGELQAARFAPNVWGVQWHPEVDDRIFRVWAEGDHGEIDRLGIDADLLVADIAAARSELVEAWRPLATRFATLMAAAR